MSDTPSSDGPKRFRSPPYPFIPLAKAVERVKQLHPKALHHQVNFAVLADAWGYGIKSSGLIQTAAALIQFGFLTDEGSGQKRKFQLTQDAIRIAQDTDPSSDKRKAAIQRAALAPKIHKELWENYGNSGVSDMVLRNYLIFDRTDSDGAAFSASSADALIEEYKSSISFAEITSAPPVSKDEENEEGEDEASDIEKSSKEEHADRGQKRRKAAAKVGMKEDVFSLKEGDVVFQWPEKLSPESFEDLDAWAKIILRKIQRSVVVAPDEKDEAAN
ncbi:MAG: hypothetical protein Q7V31_08645 [Parvibaculum sp.]|uniref:hypothetical protein n=1 Tax=Parvibaculum sp. TaxID=2024848 RepID=UPI0027263106|nr:hypothetical protein [Parvibaculum sp.]MDO8838986.1 hypothetical protein [Parvibaculum sp.]